MLSNIFRYLDEPSFASLYIPDYHYHHANHPIRNNLWSTSVSIAGYAPNEVGIKEEKDDKGEVKIVVHAKRENEDEFSEFRKSIKIPKNVDHENMRTILSKDGVLILKAPYKNAIDTYGKQMQLKREDTWNGIWSELGRLNDQMNQLVDVHGTFHRPREEFVANDNGEGGVWRLKVNLGKDFKAEEIKLRNHNNQIHLEAKKESKDNNYCSSRFVQEIISIPEGVELDKLRSKLMDNGELVVEAPCKKMPSVDKDNEGKSIPFEAGKAGDSENMAVDN